MRAARSGVALFDQSYFGKLLISGPRADAAMQWVCGNDMEGRAPGAVVYTPLCNARGGVEADVTVTLVNQTKTRDRECVVTREELAARASAEAQRQLAGAL